MFSETLAHIQDATRRNIPQGYKESIRFYGNNVVIRLIEKRFVTFQLCPRVRLAVGHT